MKDHLIFDTSDADTIIDSDSVGAFVRSDDGTLITHHTVGSDEALDVYIANTSIEVTATDLDIRDLLYTQDSVTAYQGTDPWVIGDGGNSITVDAVDLDIRDLTHVSDSIKVGDGTDFLAINADGSVNITDNGGSLTVDAIDLDIRDLVAATDHVSAYTMDGTGTAITSTVVGADTALDVNVVQGINVEVDLSHIDDSVRLGDGTNFLGSTTVGSDVGLDVYVLNDPSIADTAILSAADTLAAAGTAEKVVASNLAARKDLFIYNNHNRKMYIGSSSVDKDNGFPISPGSYIELKAGAAVDVYYDSEQTGHKIRTLELS